jgi:hypothetical protein
VVLRRLVSLSVLGVLGLAVVFAGPASAGSSAVPPVWGSAIAVPGTAALNIGGDSQVNAMSCTAGRNCATGGYYYDGSDNQQAFVDTETSGTWGTAIEVPGTSTLNAGGTAVVSSVSCSSAGNCTAGGTYTDAAFFVQAFVVDETNGVWGTAIEVPGMSALNKGNANVASISCASDGNCTAGGLYHDTSKKAHAYVVDKTSGTWGTAVEVPGLPTLNIGNQAQINSISCSTAGNCLAGGSYTDGSAHQQAFVSAETAGTWGTPIEVPGTGTLNSGNLAAVRSVSCPSDGNCSAAGLYTDGSGHAQPFAIDETGGTWGTAIQVPGMAALNSGGNSRMVTISCPTGGNCAGGGFYTDSSGFQQAWLVSETNGTWGTAIQLPGTNIVNDAASARVNQVSCPAVGSCGAAGYYVDDEDTDQDGDYNAFVINMTNGSWGTVLKVPGTIALDEGEDAQATSISCSSADNCAVGGWVLDADNTGNYVPFVAESVADTGIRLVPTTASGTYGGGPTTLSATLTFAGSAVPNESVTFSLNGTSVGSAMTNANGVATLQNVSLSGIDAGFYSAGVSASFAGDGTYSATSGTSSLSIALAPQAITITTHAPANANYGDQFTVAATGGASGNPVYFYADGSCTNSGLNGATFTMTSGAGTCDVYYDQDGDNNYDYAPELVETVTAHKANQTIQVTTHAPSNAVSGTVFTVAATGGGSASPIVFGSSGSCTNTGAQFTMTANTGTCTVTYNQAGNTNYNAATQVTETVTAGKGSQTIQITTHAPSSAVYGTGFTVAATGGGSTSPVVYGSSGACTNTGASYTMTSGTGTCTVTYDQAGDANYNAATQVTETVTAGKATQTIQITTHAPSSAVYGTGFTVAATGGGSPNAVTYGSSGACSNTGAGFTMRSGTGTCTVTYNQAGDANYSAATQATETVSAAKAGQTISITADAPSTAAYGTGFTVAATGGGSGNAIAYGSSGACTNTGASFTMTSSTGTCTVTYDQAGNTNYNAAAQKTETVNATKTNQTITFATPASHTYGNSDFDPGATASSGLAVTYGASGACSIVSGKVHLASAGSCTVTADQAGNANYNAAAQVQRTFSVGKATLTITAKNQSKYYGQAVSLGTTAFTASGLVGSDSVSGVTLTSSGAAASAPSGSYAIVPSNAVAGPSTNLAGNYTVAFQNGSLHVQAVGIIGLNGVSVSASGGKIDAFDSTHGVYNSSTNHSSTAFALSNGPLSFSGVSLFGNALSTQGSVSVASGAAVSGFVTAGTTVSNAGVVGGTVTQHAPSATLSLPTGAACSPLSSRTGISGGSFSLSSGSLTVKSGTVKLASKTYCFNNVTVLSGATLSVTGAVTMNLKGKLVGKGQIVSTTNLPARLHINSSYSSSGGVSIVGGTKAAMTILAPKTSVTVSGGSFFGTVLAATVNLTGGIQFHADQH